MPRNVVEIFSEGALDDIYMHILVKIGRDFPILLYVYPVL